MNLKTLKKVFSGIKVQILILLLLTVVSYANILQNGFSFDDRDFFLDWPTVRDSKSGLSALLSVPDLLAGQLPPHQQGVYRPIRSLYYLLSIQLWDSNPFFFHLQAIIVHSLVVIVIYNIVKFLTKNNILPFLTAALFATHPIHTEAISYAAASFDTLGILFFFTSFYFYLKAESSRLKRDITRLLSCLFAFLAFFTYEMTLTLPFLIIAYEICFKKLNLKNLSKRLTVYLPYLVLVLSYVIVRVFILKIGSRADFLGEMYLVISNQAKLATPEILLSYISILAFPVNLTISHPAPTNLFILFIKTVASIDPSGNLVTFISEIVFLFPLIVIIGLTALIIKFIKNPVISFGISWFLLSLLPVSNIFAQGATMAERFIYIPSFGFCLILGYFLYWLAANNKLPLKQNLRFLISSLIFILIISSYVSLTIVRNKDWASQESIFLSAIKVSPTDSLGNGAMGILRLSEKKPQEAINYFETALQSDPSSFRHQSFLAAAYEESGNLDLAISEYNKALQLEPKYSYANIRLGNIYQKRQEYDKAIEEFNKALLVDSGSFDAHFNLAGTYMHKKDYQKALIEYETADKLRPEQASIRNNIAYIHEQTGNPDLAILEYKKAIEIDPQNYLFHINLAAIYERKGDNNLALEQLKKAQTLKPEDQTLKDAITRLQ